MEKCTETNKDDTKTQSCRNRNKRKSHEKGDEALRVCKSEVVLNKSSLVDTQVRDPHLETLNKNALPKEVREECNRTPEVEIADVDKKCSGVKLKNSDSPDEFEYAKMQSLVSHGKVRRVHAKLDEILEFPAPKTRKELMRFLGMAEDYFCCCHNFYDVVAPLTDLVWEDAKFQWSDECQSAFDSVKVILSRGPVLAAPDIQKGSSVAMDASDAGTDPALMQEDDEEVDNPVSCFSRKFGLNGGSACDPGPPPFRRRRRKCNVADRDVD